MYVFIICVCLGVIITFIFVMKFIISHYCKGPKNLPDQATSGRSSSSGVSVITLPTTALVDGSTRAFLPMIRPINPQPYIMRGGVAVGEGTSSASFCLYPDVSEDPLGQLIASQANGDIHSPSSTQVSMEPPPPSYEDLFPLVKRELDTIDEE